jgi:TPP-dependent pyruvate/acetoin dehydrogenase alpha subunit
MFDPELYRDKEEVARWKERCPIDRFRNWALSAGMLNEADAAAIMKDAEEEIERAVAFAEASPWEPVEDLERDVMTPKAEEAR